MRIRSVLLTAVVIALVFSSGCGSKDSTAGKGISAVAVAAAPVETADIREIKFFNGQVQPVQSAVMAPKVAGRVAVVAVRIGDQVKKGGLLFQLDTSELSAQVRTQEADLAMARARLEMAQKNREYYRSSLDNYKKLYEAGAVSKDKYDEIVLKYDQAMSGEYEASVAKSEASLNYQASLLEGSTVRSPVDGVVSFVSVEAGQNVTTATQAVGVVDISTVKVKIFVGDQHINRLSKGQKVEVDIPDLRNTPYEGTVSAMGPAVDAVAKGYPVEVELPNPDGQIKQGMFARVRMAVRESKNAALVSVDSVINRPDGKYLFVVQNGKARELKIETGITEGGKVEVTAGGLKPGDLVVTLGLQSLVDGMAVRMGHEGKTGPQNSSEKPAGDKGKGPAEGAGAQGGSGK